MRVYRRELHMKRTVLHMRRMAIHMRKRVHCMRMCKNHQNLQLGLDLADKLKI